MKRNNFTQTVYYCIVALISLAAGLGNDLNIRISIFSGFTIIDVILVFLILFYFVNSISHTKRIKINRLSIIFLLLSVVQMITTFYNGIIFSKLNYEIFTFIRYLYYAVIIIYLYNNIDKENDKSQRIIDTFFILGIVLEMISIIYFFNKDPRHIQGMPSLNNNYINRNVIYYTFILQLIYTFYIYVNKRKTIYLLFSLVLGIVNLFTFSKGAFLCLFIIAVFIIFEIFKSKNGKLIFISLTTFFIIAIQVYPYVNKFIESKFTDYSVTEDNRLDYKIDALKIGFNHLLVGVGNGNYKDSLINEGFDNRITTDPHDILLQLFAENGILALFLLILVYLEMFKMCLQHRKKMIRHVLYLFVCITIFLGFLTGLALNGKFYIFIILLLLKVNVEHEVVIKNNINENLMKGNKERK